MCIRDRHKRIDLDSSEGITDYVFHLLRNAKTPVSYTQLEVYKRQVGAKRLVAGFTAVLDGLHRRLQCGAA